MSLLFLGSKQLGLSVAERLCRDVPGALSALVTIDDRDDGRSRFTQFMALAGDHALELHVARDRRHCEEIVRRLVPEYCIVAGWYWLLNPDLLATVRGGFIGIHNSLLPAYRGFSPLVWTVMNGDVEAGYSIFSLTSGMDEGALWLQRRLPVDKDDYIGDLLRRIEESAPQDIVMIVKALLFGTAQSYPQSSIGASYCTRRLPEDGLIDWREPAYRVRNMIRALSDPYPGAFSVVGGIQLKVWRADMIDTTYYGLPGQIARLESDGSAVVVAGDSHALRITDVEVAGSRGTPASYLRELNIRSLDSSR